MSPVRITFLVFADGTWSAVEMEMEVEVQALSPRCGEDIPAAMGGADGVTALPLLLQHSSSTRSRVAAVALNRGLSNNDGGPAPSLDSNNA